MEFSLNGQKGPWHYFLNASFTDATFESPVVLSSPNHPEAIGGELAVQSGDRLTGGGSDAGPRRACAGSKIV